MFQEIFTYLHNIYIYFIAMLNAAKVTSFQITSFGEIWNNRNQQYANLIKEKRDEFIPKLNNAFK